MTKSSNIILSIFCLITAIFIAGIIAPPLFLNNYLENEIRSEISNRDNFPYNINFERVDIEIWGQSASVDSIVLIPKNKQKMPATLTATSLTIDGINWFSFIRNPIPDFDEINITEPYVEIISKNLSFNNSSNASAKSLSDSAKIQLSDFNLHLKNGSAKVVHPNGDILLSIDNFNVDAQQLRPSSITGDSKSGFTDSFAFSASNISGQLIKKLYRFGIDSLNLNSDNQSAEIINLELNPLLPKYEFSKARGKQLDRLQIKIPQIQLSGFNIDSAFSGVVNLDSLTINNARLQVFRNKRIPRAPSDTLKPMVNDMANAIPFPFELNKVQVINSEITYSEHRPPSDTSASISFNKLNGTIRNFRSASHLEFGEDTLLFHAETYFQNAALLTVDVWYPVFNKKDQHYLTASLDSINPKVAKDMLLYVGFVKINDGMIHGLETAFTLDDSSSQGEVTLLYSDLDISFVNKNNPDKEGLKEKITDFFTDNFVIKSENTVEDPRIGKISFEREKEKSIFAYWWKSLLSGIKDTIK